MEYGISRWVRALTSEKSFNLLMILCRSAPSDVVRNRKLVAPGARSKFFASCWRTKKLVTQDVVPLDKTTMVKSCPSHRPDLRDSSHDVRPALGRTLLPFSSAARGLLRIVANHVSCMQAVFLHAGQE